jgi:hypothetical protein
MGVARPTAAAVAVVATSLLFAGSALARTNPDSINQPPGDGCERDPLGLVAGTTPQWVYVNGDPSARYLRGTARNARPTHTDLFRAHDSYDMNVFFEPRPEYNQFLGTANLLPGQDPDEQNTMEIEWEQRAYPLFGWPTRGDDVEIMGSWIWDCGHWGPQNFSDPNFFIPGTQPGEVVTGERTEIHPPRMVIVHRATPSVSDRGGNVADVLISSNGTKARAIEDHPNSSCGTVAPAAPCSEWTPVNDRNYEFDIAPPPRPRGAGGLRWQVIDQGSVNAPEAIITKNRGSQGIHVVVPFQGWGTPGVDMVFAKTFVLGWDVTQPVHHYRVTFDRIDWQAQLDGPCAPPACSGNPQQSQPPNEVNVYVEAAGQWRQLHPGGTGQFAPSPGDTIPLAESVDAFLVGTPTWRVYARGRECDQPAMQECAAPTEIGTNDDAGIIEDTYLGGSGVGAHASVAQSADCAGGACFTLTYRIEDLGAIPPTRIR